MTELKESTFNFCSSYLSVMGSLGFSSSAIFNFKQQQLDVEEQKLLE